MSNVAAPIAAQCKGKIIKDIREHTDGYCLFFMDGSQLMLYISVKFEQHVKAVFIE